jgi:hypothetical protein
MFQTNLNIVYCVKDINPVYFYKIRNKINGRKFT